MPSHWPPVHGAPAALYASAGQTPDAPVHASAMSHSEVAARQMKPAGWRASAANHQRASAAVIGLITEKFKAHSVLLTDSGTSALTLAIHTLCGARSNRLVALPAYGCYDIATAADGADVKVVLYDVSPHTLGPDVTSLKRALSSKPAVMAPP